jgi:hypothetical protein
MNDGYEPFQAFVYGLVIPEQVPVPAADSGVPMVPQTDQCAVLFE